MSSREIKGPNEETTRLSNLGDVSGAGPGARTPRPDEAPCPDPADNRRLPLPGSELDEYAIEAELGRGGMGVVYRAFDPRLRRHIALKLMHLEATAANLTRFRDEAQVTAQLQHPSVVPIYDIGQAESGAIYYTMRLVRGQTLAEVVSEHRARLAGGDPEAPEGWTPFKLLQMFVTVCRAASYAHDRGVVHRDLKPSNVMIGAYGEVNVLDWGLAKFLGSSARDSWTGAHEPTPGEGLLRVGVVKAGPGHQKTQAGTIVGTPAFMAPEQAYGRSPDVSFSADVYSLGAILYYILTGTPPRHGTAAEVMEQLTRRTPPPQLRTSEPGISPDLDRLCMSALASEPSDRLESATLLADSVEGYLEGRSLSTPRAQDAEFLRGYSSRHYRRPSVTVDVVLMTVPANGAARVALLCRDQPPFVGTWACPGTFATRSATPPCWPSTRSGPLATRSEIPGRASSPWPTWRSCGRPSSYPGTRANLPGLMSTTPRRGSFSRPRTPSARVARVSSWRSTTGACCGKRSGSPRSPGAEDPRLRQRARPRRNPVFPDA